MTEFEEPKLKSQFTFSGHVVRLYAQWKIPKRKNEHDFVRYLVTIDSTDLEDTRWLWDGDYRRSAGVAFLQVCGYYSNLNNPSLIIK